MTLFEQKINRYDYKYPKELVALAPARPRDSARLLVFDRTTKKTWIDTFAHLGDYLPKNTVLVLNQTKVIPARFTVTKPTGGKATLFYISHDQDVMTVLSDRKLTINSPLRLSKRLWFTVVNQRENHYLLKPSFPVSRILSILERHGRTPIPPYLRDSPLTESRLRREYQTVFAKIKGSVAAPTASLHFTASLLKKLAEGGVQLEYITLHVNRGTFAPLTQENMKRGKLHSEYYEIKPSTAQRLNQAKLSGKPIIAVGTTVVRALESAALHSASLRDKDKRGVPRISARSEETDLFIKPGYRFRFVDGLITNFHVPKSSLLMLVSALTGRKKLLELYQLAIEHRFRLFSFGDGMMIV